MGMGASVTHDVSGHRALKKQRNNDRLKGVLQTNFSYFNKMTSFTNIMTNVGTTKVEILLKTSQNVCGP